MDKEVVFNKLESLRRCIARVEDKTPATVMELIDDLDLQDIIALNLGRAVQICVDIGLHIIADLEVAVPDSMSETFRTLEREGIIDESVCRQLSKAVGFRNTAVHAYQEIDWEIVYNIISTRLGDFRAYAARMIEIIDGSNPQLPSTS